ncbi:flagellar hook-associated 2 domain-containing protein [Thermodesulfatator indicus DSM 15286]|uniref:Flagellar hook-associated protein 2 n=1 Tax=Thermodesulfatator indicus (strain DSM 15286 / JCM 11887 / CIR29812) TaxID=667014 RepID=F8A866_THEID|nr:flagellar filament capping protein FliD [Thermodesulfatator indicus]AEH44336.1 flagellar hook-associated 2 domain-containing protein [Thermodesulfatator indicus DSM 15286]
MADEVFGKINVLGLGSGLDLQGLLDNLRTIEEKPIKALEAKKDFYEKRLTEFDWLNTKVLSLKSKSLDFSLESTYLTRQVSVSGSAITAEADVGALEGNYTVEVNQLARKSLWQSQGFAESSSVITPSGDDVLQIQVGDKNFSVLVPQGTTLEGLADLINNSEDNPGVEAKVVNTGAATNPYRLVLKAKDAGEDHRIVVTQELSGVSFEEITGTPNIWSSAQYTNPEDVINNTGSTITLNINVGEASITVDVPDGTTLSGLVDLINNASDNSSLKAYLMRNSDGNYTVQLRSPDAISVTQSPDTPTLFSEVNSNGESLNAFLTVDGISYQRNSNSINDIIPGVTINLKEIGTSSLSVSANYDDIKEKFKSFIDEISSFVKELGDKMSFDVETGEEGPLYRSNAAESLMRDIRNVLTVSFSGNEHIRSLFDLGLNFNRDGSITLDEKKLEKAFAEHPEEIKKLFLGDDDNNFQGIAEKINDTLQKYIGPTGFIALEQKTTERNIEDVKRNIAMSQERVDRYIATLQRQFMALDEYVQQLNNLSSYLDVQFKSMMGLNQKK